MSIHVALKDSYGEQQEALYLNDLRMKDWTLMIDLKDLLNKFMADKIVVADVLIKALQLKHPDKNLDYRLILRMIGLLEDWVRLN